MRGIQVVVRVNADVVVGLDVVLVLVAPNTEGEVELARRQILHQILARSVFVVGRGEVHKP